MKSFKAEINFKIIKTMSFHSTIIYKVGQRKFHVDNLNNLSYQLNFLRQEGIILSNERELYQTVKSIKKISATNMNVKVKWL